MKSNKLFQLRNTVTLVSFRNETNNDLDNTGLRDMTDIFHIFDTYRVNLFDSLMYAKGN